MKIFLKGLLLALPALFLSASNADALYRTSEQFVEVAENEVIEDDVFLAGETVVVRGTINGDLYALGGSIEIDGNVSGDIITAGGTVVISGTVGQDIRAAGGTISINDAEVADGVSLIGGSLSIDSGSSVGGSMLTAGGSVINRANIGRHFIAGAGTVSLSGQVAGDAEIGAGGLTIGPGASISGNLRYPEESDSTISEAASIAGTIERFPGNFRGTDFHNTDTSQASSLLFATNFGFTVWAFFSALLIGLAILYLFPETSLAVAETLRTNTLKSILVGLVGFMVAGPILLMLLISVIGIPLAFILFAKYLIDIYLAKLIVGLAIGLALRDQFEWRKLKPYMALALGLLAYYLLGFVPVVNFFTGLLTLFAGLGALYIWKWDVRKKLN